MARQLKRVFSVVDGYTQPYQGAYKRHQMSEEHNENSLVTSIQVTASQAPYGPLEFQSNTEVFDKVVSSEVFVEVVSPKVISPEVFVEVVSPKVFVEVVSPKVVSPEVFVEVVSPEVVSPEVFSPEVVSPEVVSPEVVSPEVFSPEVVSPEVVVAKVVSPKVSSRADVIDEEDEAEMTKIGIMVSTFIDALSDDDESDEDESDDKDGSKMLRTSAMVNAYFNSLPDVEVPFTNSYCTMTVDPVVTEQVVNPVATVDPVSDIFVPSANAIAMGTKRHTFTTRELLRYRDDLFASDTMASDWYWSTEQCLGFMWKTQYSTIIPWSLCNEDHSMTLEEYEFIGWALDRLDRIGELDES
jgi:hypothetical protein